LEHISLIGTSYISGKPRLFNRSQDEAITYIYKQIDKKDKVDLSDQRQVKELKQLKFSGNLLLARMLMDRGDYREAEKVTLELVNMMSELGIKGRFKFQMTWIIKSLQFDIAYNLNQLKKAKEIGNFLNQNLEKMLKLSSIQIPKRLVIDAMINNLQYLISIGDKETVLTSISLMLENLDPDSNNLHIIELRIKLLETFNEINNQSSSTNIKEISKLKEKIEFPTFEKILNKIVEVSRFGVTVIEREKAIRTAAKLNKIRCDYENSQSIDSFFKICTFDKSIRALLIPETIEYLSKEKNQSINKYIQLRQQETNEDIKEFKKYIKSNQNLIEMVQNEKTFDQIKFGKIFNIDNEGNKYEITKENKLEELEKNEQDFRNAIKLFNEELLFEYKLTKFFDEVSEIFQRLLLINYPNNIVLLNQYQQTFNHNMGWHENNELASFYAKKYINLFQDIRSKLENFSNTDQLLFTKKYKEFLKDAISIFYLVGDQDAARVAFTIIKENEYLDFIQRSAVDTNFLSRLTFLDYEKVYERNLKKSADSFMNLRSEINIFQDEPYDSVKFLELKNTFERLIADFNRQRLNFINQDFKQLSLIRKNKEDKLNEIKNEIQGEALGKNEAQLYISLSRNKIKSYLFTENFSDEFIQEIDMKSFTELNNNLALSIQKNKKIDSQSVIRLSKLLIKNSFDKIHELGIKKIKLFLADNILLNVPVAMLRHNGNLVLDNYSFEYSTLNKANEEEVKKNQNFDLYGVTEGTGQFSDLPGVLEEIESLSTAKLGEKLRNKSIYLDKNFTKDSLVESFKKNNDYIHIATHFNVSGNTDELTQLLLGNKDIINLKELRSLLPTFNNQLIVLSACESANTQDFDNDNIYDGLAGVFQEKGANNVLATLWEISDEATSTFMLIFYSLLSSNDISPSTALAFTQRIFKDSSFKNIPSNLYLTKSLKSKISLNSLKNFSHPYFWSGFIIYTSQ